MIFEGYSEGARQVIFVARHVAGQGGSSTIDPDHLLLALIYEDQGQLSKALSDAPELQHVSSRLISRAHESFFSSDEASDLRRKIEENLPRSEPLPSSTEIPMSSDLKQALAVVPDLLDKFKQNQIEPLHLLAAVLALGSSQGGAMLRQAGITQERIMEAIARRG